MTRRPIRRFVHYYPKATLEHGGVSFSLWHWAEAVAELTGLEALVLHAGGPFRGEYADSRAGEQTVPHLGRRRPTYLALTLERHLQPGDLLVLHDGWVASNLWAARTARRVGVPYVVMPHGAYETTLLPTLRLGRYRAGPEGRMLAGAAAAHVFYESEKPLVQRFAPAQDRFIVAHNGIDRVPVAWCGGGGHLSWFGRLDVYHKGLDLLVEAMALLTRNERPHLRLHGFDYNGGLARLTELVRQHGVSDDVTIGGPVSGESKWELMRNTDGYVHVSRWESASLALLEHMSAGVPMLVSETVRMADTLGREALAATTGLAPEQIARGLLELSSGAVSGGQRLRDYTDEHFSWQQVAHSFVTQLSSLLYVAH